MYFVYILECNDKSLYAGITWDLEKRLQEHNNGLSLSTKSRLPVNWFIGKILIVDLQQQEEKRRLKVGEERKSWRL